MTTNRTALISKVYKVLKKHYKPVAPPTDRTVLEHLVYACLLENSRYEAADEAFAKLKELYFDWNEIRVTTVTELAEGMAGIPDASAAAQRVKKALQSIYEAAYSFDMELFKKQNLGKAEKDLEKINGVTLFVRAYVTQNALAGHSIPVSSGALSVLHAVGVVSDAEADKLQVPGLERAIPKNKGVEFASLLQQIGADFFASPGSSKLKGILSEVDPDFKDRMVKRQVRMEAEAAVQAAAAKEARHKARVEARAAAMMPKSPTKGPGKDGKGGPGDKSKGAADKDSKGKPAAGGKKKEEPAGAKASSAKPGFAKKKPR